MSKNPIQFKPKEMASLLNTMATSDLKKEIEEELENPTRSRLTMAQLIELSDETPLVFLGPEDPQEREQIERDKEAKLIDKVDAKFGAKYEDT